METLYLIQLDIDRLFVYLTVPLPDIAFVVHAANQFIVVSTSVRWSTISHMLQYFQGTKTKARFLSSTSSLTFQAYSDPDHA